MSYNTLNNYYKNTLNKEENQDYTVSKCYGNICSLKNNESKDYINNEYYKNKNSNIYVEDYSTISLRGSIHPPYSNCYGNPDCKRPKYTGVS